MLIDATAKLNLLPAASWMVGDKASDIEAGIRSGVSDCLHVKTGHGLSQVDKVDDLRSRAPGVAIHSADSVKALAILLNAAKTSA